MEGAILTYILENIPWLAAVIIASVACWKLSKYHSALERTKTMVDNLPCEDNKTKIEQIDSKLSTINKSVNKFPCSEHTTIIKDVESGYNAINNTVVSTNNMVTEIATWIMKFDQDMIDKLARKASPLKMTNAGEYLFESSPAKNTINENAVFLIQEIEDENPLTAFDVEKIATNVLLKNIGHEMFNEVKQFLYYSPEMFDTKYKDDKGEPIVVKLSLQLLIQLMAIYLRDLYLDIHTEIK